MSNNLDSDRSVTTNKMYPIDLAPQKITIVKSVPNSDVKMSHLVTGQPKTTGPSQIIAHTGPLGLMRPSPQIISSSVSSQPHMIVSSSPMLAGTQMVSQGSQGIGQNTQILSQSQLIGPGGQLGPGTQIISQGTQLNANSGAGNTGGNLVSVSTSGPVLNVGGQLVSGSGNLVVSSSVRTLPPSVRVLPPLQHHNARPVLSNVSLNTSIGSGTNVMVSKTGSSHVSHVPRGLAAGASLAVPRVATRPAAPVTQTLPISSLGTAWSSASRGVRGAVVYSARAPRAPQAVAPVMQRAPAPALLGAPVSSPAPAHTPLSTVVTVPPTSVLTSTGVITAGVRSTPRVPAPASRPMPLVQRNYQPPAKLLGVPNVGVRPVGNSAPSQLYYEVSRPGPPQSPQRPPTPFHQLPVNNQVNVLNVRVSPETRPPPAPLPPQPRPTILRKRDVEGSPTKNAGVGPPLGYPEDATTWESRAPSPEHLPTAPDNDGGGSTTESAASSPAPDDDPPSPPAPPPRVDRVEPEISPRKKPRKQALSSEVRQCEYAPEEKRVSPPPAVIKPPPKRPQLSSSYVCGWRATALHFSRPSDVRRREARPRDILAIANQKHVIAAAEGWKVHHLTAQMDDLVSLEADVSEQLGSVLRTLEAAHGKAQAILAPHSHALLELVKGNIQRSRIVCEGVQEAREDILRVFTHRTFVSDILSRQADKRCFRKHRSQS